MLCVLFALFSHVVDIALSQQTFCIGAALCCGSGRRSLCVNYDDGNHGVVHRALVALVEDSFDFASKMRTQSNCFVIKDQI